MVKKAFLSLWRIVQGIFIGIGAMLPGISGGVMCVLFGIYRPMMELLSHPIRAFKKHSPLILPVLVGWVGGFWLASHALASIFQMGQAQVYAIWLFFGLVVGTMPSLWKTATEKGVTRGSLVSLLIAFALALAFFFTFRGGEETVRLEGTLLAWLFCGVTWGISLIVPGLSSSALLMYFGLYQQMNAGVRALDFSVILPWLVGILLVVVFCTRGVNYLFKRAYAHTYQALFGIMAASAVAIIPYGAISLDSGESFPVVYDGSTIPFYVLFFVLGALIAWGFDVLGEKIVPKDDEPSDPDLAEQEDPSDA